MGQALYRKYRSKSLTEMVGQEHVTTALGNSVASGRISHAYLFTGPRGVGKTSAARILAHLVNGLPYDDDTQHLDIIEIDAASNRRIDDIRDLRDRVHIAPTSSKYKVYIIDEVHMLTGESFNALLKTLEEPPQHVIFILATTEAHKLPATIISRTQRYNFRLVEMPQVVQHLRFIADQENITVDDSALELVAEHGEGSFRDSINLLDQLANVNNSKIDAASVERSLGLAPKQAISALVEAINRRDHQALIAQLTELEQQGTTTAALLPQLIRYLQSQALQHTDLYGLIDQLLDVPRAYNPRLKLLTTLVQFVLPSSQPAPSPVASKTTPVDATKPIIKPKPAKHKDESNKPQQAEGPKLTDITPEQWTKVLTSAKERNAPMYSILRQAQPVFDASTQTLTLKFRYALHRKRIEDAKPKKELADLIQSVLGGAPIIQTELDSAAVAPDVATQTPQAPKPAVDSTAESVIAIMGGGEVVDA